MTDPASKLPHDDADDLFNVPAISPKRPGADPPKRPGLESVERAITRAEQNHARRKHTSAPPPKPVAPVAREIPVQQEIGDPTEPLPPSDEPEAGPSLRNIWIACGAIVVGALMAVAVPVFKRASAPPLPDENALHDIASKREPVESGEPRDPSEWMRQVAEDPIHEPEPTPHVVTIPTPPVQPPVETPPQPPVETPVHEPVETAEVPPPTKPPVEIVEAPPIPAPTPPRLVEPEPAPVAHTDPIAERPPQPVAQPVMNPAPNPAPDVPIPTTIAKLVRPVPVPAPSLSGAERLQAVETALAAGRRAFARAELGRILLDLDALPAGEREETRVQAELILARTLQLAADEARRTSR